MTSRESRALVRGSAHRRKLSKERPPDLSDLRIVLLGKSASHNSVVGNFILGRAAFDSEAPPDVIERVRGRLKDRHVIIINSPQLLQTNISDHQITQTVRECVYLSDPGPHAFILILQNKDFTEEDRHRVEYVLETFSEEAIKLSIVITTDEETDKAASVKVNEFIQQLTAECGGGHLQLDHEIKRQFSGISQRLEKILRENNEEFLICELNHDAQETLLDEDQSRSSASLRAQEEDPDRDVSATRQQKLNLVLCGSDETLKKSISKLIKHKRRGVELHGRQISLLELPALFNTRLSEEEVMCQTLRCVSLCDPGVHVFLIITDAPLNNEDKAEMEEIQRIFSSRINKHIMFVIMQDSEHQTAELNEETKSVIESFGGGHHFFGPKTQVSTLMEKIEQMLEENRGECFSTETFLEAQMIKLLKYEEMKKKIHSLETHLLTRVSKENTEELRIVLLGKTGVGKSATGNTILGREAFTAETTQESVTKESQRETSEINGRRVTVIDTPGLFDTELSNEEIQREISNCISMILPGPHVFIIVLSLGQRFTREEAKSVKIIQEMFGENAIMYTMVLFTRGDDLKNKTIEQCLGKPESPLMKLIEACGNRFHVFNNNQTEDRTQVSDLLEKIDNMVKTNGGSFYSCKMFRQMEREKQEQQMKILMDRVREREEMMKKLEEEKERMKMMMEEERQNQDKERKRREELKREIREQEKHQREIRDEMRREQETFRQEIEEMRQEKEKIKKEREKLKTEYDTEIDRLMNRIENERQNHETERKRREEEFNEREERYKTMKEKEELMKKQEEEKERNEERKRREQKFKELEERYQTLMKEKEESEKKMCEKMKREREEWEKQKLEEKTRREEEDEKRREKEQRDWDEFNQRLKEERERMEREKEDLQSKHEEEENKMKMMERMNREREELMKKQEEKERMKMMMEEERHNQDKERKKREEEFREREERYKRLIKDREEKESKLLEQMKQERMQREKQKHDERQKREEEKKKIEETEKQKSKPYMKQQSEVSDLTTGLNLVLLGRTGAGKSASGDTILGRQAFILKRRPTAVAQDVAVESGTVCGFPVTVYDTPGLYETQINENQIQYQSILQKCESGHCVFLLVIKADSFTEEERKTVEKIEKLLAEERLNKTWILFTRGDELEEENMTIQEFISETEPLKKLLQKYDQRYHVFNNKKRGHTQQVQELLIKILKSYFHTVVGEDKLKLNSLKRKIPENVEAVTPTASRRIVLLSKSGVGKSAVGNTILGKKVFRSAKRVNAVTSVCSEAHATVSGRSVSVVDTPGFFHSEMKPEEFMIEIARSIYLSSPGPHAFLIVFPVNMRFTEQDQLMPQMIEMMFGEEVLKYSIILFTHGDQLEGEPIEELIKQNCRLKHLVDQCGDRFHVFNNKDQNNREQVNDLLQKIDSIQQNGGGHYSNQMFEDAQRFRQEEEERRQREEEERKQQEEEQRQEEIERVIKETEMRIRQEFEALERRAKKESRREEEQRK